MLLTGIGGTADAIPNERIPRDAGLVAGVCLVVGRHSVGGFGYFVI